MNSFYSEEELKEIGFKSIGTSVLISKKCSIYGAQNISIGSNVRIDDFCILSGKIEIGNYIHIAAGSMLFAGNEGIIFEDFSGLSSRCAVYAASDDYSGDALTNPTVPDEYRNVTGGTVIFKRHAIIGAGSTVLPNTIVGEGASVGSMSLVNKSIEGWGIYVGIPCRRVKDRSKHLLELEKEFLSK